MELEKLFITNSTNMGKPNNNEPTFIVIHDTGNTSKTAGAYNHRQWLQNTNNTKRSAHIYVDSKRAIQTIPFTTPAWHTGVLYVAHPEVPTCTNFNSVGIEFCINADGNIEQTIANTLLVTQKVMDELHIPYARVITHQQSSGKDCPGTFINNPKLKDLFFNSLFARTAKNNKDEALSIALDVLQNHKVTNSKAYWFAQAQDVKHLRQLIINMANVL